MADRAKYEEAIKKVLQDEELREKMNQDPAGTLEGLGIELTPEAREALRRGDAMPPETVAAWTRPLVNVATRGTKPVVQSAVLNVVLQEREPGERGARAEPVVEPETTIPTRKPEEEP